MLVELSVDEIETILWSIGAAESEYGAEPETTAVEKKLAALIYCGFTYQGSTQCAEPKDHDTPHIVYFTVISGYPLTKMAIERSLDSGGSIPPDRITP
jgi:hypothetical protein